MLWLAIYLPQLSLEALSLSEEQRQQPLAVMALQDGQRGVLASNAIALAAGVSPGMNLAAALGLCPTLLWQMQQGEAEAQVLQQTALWALAFTPTVSIDEAPGLLLEIGGCLAYFGGFELLQQQLWQGLLALGFTPQLAAAPNPAAAMLLARAGVNGVPVELSHLVTKLDAVPLTLLLSDRRRLEWLQGLGLQTVGDCRHLPRAGLSRRLGPGFLQMLDRLYGLLPDPRPLVVPPASFRQSIVLPYPVEQAEALLFAGRRLCQSAAGFLAGHGAGARLLRFELGSRGGRVQPLEIGLLAACRNAEQFVALLREHLQHTTLDAAVEVLQLEIVEHEPLHGSDLPLWQQSGQSQADEKMLLAQLLSRLQARLGRGALRRISGEDEHRPEKAFALATLSQSTAAVVPVSASLRPCWLLSEPQLLSLVEGAPWFEGALLLSAAPERIETGWWDELPSRRDYFLARAGGSGACYWVFRDHVAGLWYLHGVFA